MGPLIALCGIDGSGKTLHSRLLSEWLNDQGWAVLHTKPLHREASAFFRTLDYINQHWTQKWDSGFPKEFIVLLYAFECLRNIREEILPAREKGQAVVCDRYIYSHEAYALAQDVDFNWGSQILALAPRPDITFLLDLPAELALQRIARRGKPLTPDETAPILQRVREQYLTLAAREGLIRIDATREIPEVQQELREYLSVQLPALAARASIAISEA